MQDKLRKLNDAQIMLIIFLCVIFLCLLTICNGHNWGGDFSQYLAQTRAISERLTADDCDAAGNGDAGEGGAAVEGEGSDRRNALRNGNFRQRAAVIERYVLNSFQSLFRQGDGFQIRAVPENVLSDGRHAVFNFHFFDLRPVGVPRHVRFFPVIVHGSGSADGQQTVAVQRPSNVVAVSAAPAAVYYARRARRKV